MNYRMDINSDFFMEPKMKSGNRRKLRRLRQNLQFDLKIDNNDEIVDTKTDRIVKLREGRESGAFSVYTKKTYKKTYN